MTITPMQLYWITRLDGFVGCSITFSVVFGLLTVGLVCAYCETNCEGGKEYPRIRLWHPVAAFVALLLCVVVGVLLPTTKEMAAILIIPKIVNNEKVQALPEKLVSLADAWMDELKPVEKK